MFERLRLAKMYSSLTALANSNLYTQLNAHTMRIVKSTVEYTVIGMATLSTLHTICLVKSAIIYIYIYNMNTCKYRGYVIYSVISLRSYR